MQSLAQWLAGQHRHSAAAMLRSVSATSITKIRAGFSQSITPKPGSVLASPVPGAYDPDPDYFFHWYRDSALVMDALRLLHRDAGPAAASLRDQFALFLQFSLDLNALDGRLLRRSPRWRTGIGAAFVQFARSDEELDALRGDGIAADARVNPDGSLDISRWARPQHDGPPLRALCVLRWLQEGGLDEQAARLAETLLLGDLAFTHRHWSEPCYDIWEEELGLHYYTLRVSAAALEHGARWLQARDAAAARDYASAARAALQRLDSYWLESEGHLRSRILSDGRVSAKDLDISVILAAVHAGGAGAHAPDDARILATLDRLDHLFDADYAINRGRAAGRGPALGRYRGDVYFSGGAYYFSTLGAAELCYRAAAHAPDARALIARGDAYLETVRAFTPGNGAMSEQFDQRDGKPRSAPELAWSYAALISCAAARRALIPPGV